MEGQVTDVEQEVMITNNNLLFHLQWHEQDNQLADFIESRINNSILFNISPGSVKHVIEDFKNISNNKATGLDRIGIKPLKLVPNVIAPSLCHMHNASIASGCFPNNFKKAN